MKKSRRFLTVWGMVIVSFFLQGIKVYASEEKEEKTSEYDYIDKWLSSNDFSKVNEGMDSLFPDMEMDSGELLVMIMEGNVLEAVKMFAGQVKDNLAGEW